MMPVKTKPLSAAGAQILEALANYRLLTISHLIELGISPSEKYLQRLTKQLKDAKLINGHHYFGVGKLYALTRKGAQRLADIHRTEIAQIMPNGMRLPEEFGIKHAIGLINCHIAMMRSAKSTSSEIEFFHTYLDPRSKAKQPAGAVPQNMPLIPLPSLRESLIADGLFFYFRRGEHPRLTIIEYYRHMLTKRVHGQLLQHIDALEADTIAKVYNIAAPWQVLSIFDTKNAASAALKRCKSDKQFATFASHFGFASLEAAQADFDGCFKWIDSKKRSIF